MAVRMLPSRSGALVSTYSLQLRRYLPSDSSMSPMVVSPLLFAPCRPLPSVMMPTGATSPSSRALVACVVPWAMNTTSSGLISHWSMTLCSTCTMPAATPSAAVWVVGTFALPTTSKVSLSMATASVKVPPTSIPIRTFIEQNLLFFLLLASLRFDPGRSGYKNGRSQHLAKMERQTRGILGPPMQRAACSPLQDGLWGRKWLRSRALRPE